MSLVGTSSPTSRTLKKRCSSASRHISRSGLIRELNGTRANCRRAGKDRQRDLGLQSGEGVGVLAANVRKFTLVRCLLNNSDIFIFAKGRFPGSLDLSQNLLSFGSPDVTLWIEVMLEIGRANG